MQITRVDNKINGNYNRNSFCNSNFLIKTADYPPDKISFGAKKVIPIEQYIQSHVADELRHKGTYSSFVNEATGFKYAHGLLENLVQSLVYKYGNKPHENFYHMVYPYVIKGYQEQIILSRGNKDGFAGINELRKKLQMKLSKYDNGSDVYNCADYYYIIHLNNVLEYLQKRPDCYNENHSRYFCLDYQKYLEQTKSKYGTEAVYSGLAPAICGFETLNYLMDKPVLADTIMKDNFQAMTIFSHTFEAMTNEHIYMPSRYKDAFVTTVDYLASEEGSKILSDKTFNEGLYVFLDNMLSPLFEDNSAFKIENIKRAAKDPEFLKEYVKPFWQRNFN